MSLADPTVGHMSWRTARHVRWGWLLTAGLALVIPVLALGLRGGDCFDAATQTGAASTCTSGPVVGFGGALVLSSAGVFLAVYAGYRAIRREGDE
jgi:hypothetical protein